MIMLWCTRLHVYIHTSLVTYVRSRLDKTPANDNNVIDNDGVLWHHWRVRKSIGNGVNIFAHLSSTPSSILNLATSSESQYNDVSNDILSVRKYSQLFTHESNTFLLKHLYQANRFTNTAQRWRQSLFIDWAQTDTQWKHDLRQFHSVHLADIMKPFKCTCSELT